MWDMLQVGLRGTIAPLDVGPRLMTGFPSVVSYNLPTDPRRYHNTPSEPQPSSWHPPPLPGKCRP